MALGFTDVDLARASNLGRRILDHLAVLGNPAGQAPDSEQRGEHLHPEAHGAVNQAGVEVDVRVEVTGDEVIIGQGDFLELGGEVEQLVSLPEAAQHLVGGFLDDGGARVVGLVNAVAKAH